MKKQLQFLAIWFITASIGMAQIIAVESFDYDTGDDFFEVDGGEGWNGPWISFGGGDVAGFTIEDEGDLPDGVDIYTTGNRLRGEVLTGTDFRAYRELETAIEDDGSDIWLSFLLESENAIDASWQGVSFWSPFNPSDTPEGEQSLFGKDWAKTNYGAVLKGTSVDTEILVEGLTPVWIVVKVELSGDGENEDLYLWVNPDPTTEPSTDDASSTVNGALNNGVTHIACHFGNTVGIIVYFDELRLANTFEEVVPKEEIGINKTNIATNISSNYPNPFTTSTTIEYNVAGSELVNLEIYNIVGEKVETLVSELQTQGKYEVKWNALDQPSGIYFYKLQVGDVSETHKIIMK